MKKIFILASIAILLTSCTSKNNISFDIKFGILDVKNDAYVLKKETKTIPLITKDQGQIHGMLISPSNNKPYSFYIIAYLPKKPKVLGGIIEDVSPSQATKGIRTPTQKARGVSIMPMWFDEGDPLGKYKLELYINDNFYESIEFEAVKLNKNF